MQKQEILQYYRDVLGIQNWIRPAADLPTEERPLRFRFEGSIDQEVAWIRLVSRENWGTKKDLWQRMVQATQTQPKEVLFVEAEPAGFADFLAQENVNLRHSLFLGVGPEDYVSVDGLRSCGKIWILPDLESISSNESEKKKAWEVLKVFIKERAG